MVDDNHFPPRDFAMRRFLGIVLAAFLAAGCRHGRKASPVVPEKPVVMQPLDGAVGRVIRINPRLKFVVLDYSLNRIPGLGTHLKLYRGLEIVGEVALNGPVQGETAAADIISGTPELGDQARME